MKNIGILTLQYALNYGGLLQCYALKETLKGMGYNPVIIDRIPDGFGLKYVFKRTFVHPFTQKNYAGMRRCELRPMSKPVYSSKDLEELLKDFDACVVGSDQVWRKGIFSVAGDYFFQNVNIPNVIKIAYAASLGVSEWEYDKKETEEISDALAKFKAISVREADGIDMLKNHCHVFAKNVLDPTLLADVDIYKPLIEKSKKSGRGKIVTYILDWTDEKRKIVEQIESLLDKNSLDINPVENKNSTLYGRLFKDGVTVYDWVKLVSTADYVITDSFHGTVFSIIFGRPFTTIGNIERGMARFTSLLGMFGLQNRLVLGPVNDNLAIDYSRTNEILALKRKESLAFLTESLRKVVMSNNSNYNRSI